MANDKALEQSWLDWLEDVQTMKTLTKTRRRWTRVFAASVGLMAVGGPIADLLCAIDASSILVFVFLFSVFILFTAGLVNGTGALCSLKAKMGGKKWKTRIARKMARDDGWPDNAMIPVEDLRNRLGKLSDPGKLAPSWWLDRADENGKTNRTRLGEWMEDVDDAAPREAFCMMDLLAAMPANEPLDEAVVDRFDQLLWEASGANRLGDERQKADADELAALQGKVDGVIMKLKAMASPSPGAMDLAAHAATEEALKMEAMAMDAKRSATAGMEATIGR